MNGDGISEKKIYYTSFHSITVFRNKKNKYLDVKEGLSGIKKNFHLYSVRYNTHVTNIYT